MTYVNIQILQNLLKQYTDAQKLYSSFQQLKKTCHFETKYSHPIYSLSAAKNINKRLTKYQEDAHGVNGWQFGQFKIFIWIVIFKALIKQLLLSQFVREFLQTQEIIKEIQSILHSKNMEFIKYQIKMIKNCFQPASEGWENQQIELLQKQVEKQSMNGDINWRWVSYSIFIHSKQSYFKCPNRCREKWYNHLNPLLKKGKWTLEEDMHLFILIEKYGLKWALISKCMDNSRTEHMVKNRYNYFVKINKIKGNLQINIPSLRRKIGNLKMAKSNEVSLKIEESKIKYEQNEGEQRKIKIENSQNIGSIEQNTAINIKTQHQYENQIYLLPQQSNKNNKIQYFQSSILPYSRPYS